ncbi:MAG TPA: DegT/DnrJ/EryC1/StrS family aminotransferase [Gammaproteobacteria bacterium]|nr:DegT/DnrJ/EryC1/StrS family aminotransferase [Gammaproteobacteria bacterium]
MPAQDFIPQMEPCLDEKEVEAMTRYLQSGGWLTEFRETQEFERRIAEYTGARFCFAVNNGTIALTSSLLAFGIGVGDEVLVPDLTMIATANCATLIGAKPIFVDIDKSSLCMDIEKAAEAITPRTKALIHVSFNGRANDLDEFIELCRRKDIYLIEDAAQSLGSTCKGRHLGTFGEIGVFSFSSPKIITTGQGGALVTDDENIAARLGKIKDFGRLGGGNDVHDSIGYNFKFTDLQAVIGNTQMSNLDWRVSRKKEIYNIYSDRLYDIEALELIPTETDETTPWFIDVYVDNRDILQDYLTQNGFGSRPIYPPIHSQRAYGYGASFPVTEHYSSRGLWLPSSLLLTDDEINRICDTVKKYFREL